MPRAECPICYTNKVLTSFYLCNHEICKLCKTKMTLSTCPMCREQSVRTAIKEIRKNNNDSWTLYEIVFGFVGLIIYFVIAICFFKFLKFDWIEEYY